MLSSFVFYLPSCLNRKIFDWEKHHQSYIEQWEEMHDNMDENNEPHTNREFRWYQAWSACNTL